MVMHSLSTPAQHPVITLVDSNGNAADLSEYVPGIGGGRAKSSSGTVYPSLPGIAPVSVSPTTRAIDTIYYEPMVLPTSAVLDELWIEVTTLAASGVARLGIYAADSDWQPIGNPLVTTDELSTATTGIKPATGLATTLDAGTYVRVSRFGTAAPALRSIRGSVVGSSFMTTLGAGSNIIAYTKSEVFAGTFASPASQWDTVTGGTTPFENTVVCIFSSVS